MSSKDKNFQDKLLNFFKRNKGHVGNAGNFSPREFTLRQDVIKDLSKESPLNVRTKTLKELITPVETCKLAENVVEKLWSCIEDLLDPEQCTETRHLTFAFLQSLIRGQGDRIKCMRAQFFRIIKYHEVPKDVEQRLDLLMALTSNGKDILYFEEDVGPFLLNWIEDITKAGRIEDYLKMIDNIIKFNAAYLDEATVNGFIEHVCILCCSNTGYSTVSLCLQIMSNVIAFSNMAPEFLPKFIGALCRTVNLESYCQQSWTIMKQLLGTYMGHSTLYTMCRILQEPVLKSDTNLLRGAVFFIHMALWGVQPIPNLHCPPSSVLPSFLQALKSKHPAIAYEVVIGLQQLINKHGLELQDPAWSILLQIILYIIRYVDTSQCMHIKTILHKILNCIENLIESTNYNGDIKQFFSILDECSADRPENSVLKLLMYLSKAINPTEHLWLTNLYNMLQKYFKTGNKTSIRLKTLEILTHVIKLNRIQYEDEIIDRIIIPHMVNIAQDNDIVVRCAVIKLLVDLCIECESKRTLDMLDILEKLLYRPFETLPIDVDHSDIVCLATSIITLFVAKIYRLPSSHAIKIYKMLATFLEKHYAKPQILENCPQVRCIIFECFFKMRADYLYRLGYPEENKLRYSPYICVTYSSCERGPMGSPPPQSPVIVQQPACTISYVSLRRAFKVFIICLKIEKDWEVLNLVLNGMAKGLQNKALVLSKQGNNELDLLVDVLCAMVLDKSMNLPESLNVKVSKPDFHTCVLNVLVNVASYHSFLDQLHQQKLIKCLMKCIQGGPRTSKQCISALMICTLEMKDVMVKMLPEVLLNLSKISATVHIAIPVLEFLSTLTQLPTVFTNFIADQYMAVFAISLPYTNPFKYNHYTVSLAHHVIAVWFLKCRLPFRKDFVRFITNGLQTNVLVPFEETYLCLKSDLTSLNQDSSDRKRSSSLTEQGSRRRTTVSSVRRPIPERINKSLIAFYEELTETCIDLMARYAFSPCSALPRRLPTAEFLLNGGQSMSWLIGNKLVTITTSGCSQKVLKEGLCDKCWTFCNLQNEGKLKKGQGGSSDTDDIPWGSRQNSNEKSSNTSQSISSPQDENKKIDDKPDGTTKLEHLVSADVHKQEKHTCVCWCQGWAEIYIRRPTGDMSWVMRIQNSIEYTHAMYEFPLNELSTLFMPSLYPETTRPQLHRQDTFDENNTTNEEQGSSVSITGSPKQSPSRQNSQDSFEEEDVEYVYDDESKSRNPVRRSNSSPEMTGTWKNPFLQHKIAAAEGDNKNSDDKKNKLYSKDMRVSCEAIPEEIAGTTPPSNESSHLKTYPNPHPSLLSCHSYPGSSPPKDTVIAPKPYQTVPPSPNVGISSSNPPEFPKKQGNFQNLVVFNAGKPPQSPTQMSPRLMRHGDGKGHEIQKSFSSSIIEKDSTVNLNLAREKARERKNSGSVERLSTMDFGHVQKRDRVHTISVMSTSTRKARSEMPRQSNRSKEAPKSGINPSFVFLQMYHAAYFGNKNERPLLVGSNEIVQRAVKVLDTIPPYETHKIGVLYVREGQINSEVEILKNQFGSLRYIEFLQHLGTMVRLADVDPQIFFLGGLDKNGGDGKFAYIWQDDVVRVTFHVATIMPNKESDPNCNNKKLHIGNNYVNIVYNESSDEFDINTIKGQFNFACIIIQPLEYNTNRVVIKVKDDLSELIPIGEPKIISDQNVATLARQLALHANLASLVISSLKNKSSDPYASNWLERLRKIKNIRNKIIQIQSNDDNNYPAEDHRRHMEDFTDYT